MVFKSGRSKSTTPCRTLLALFALLFLAAGRIDASTSGAVCISSSGSWRNTALSQTQTGNFRVSFDATPTSATMNAISGLSSGLALDYPDLAAAVRFNPGGTIDVRNGSTFAATNRVPYSAGVTYHFVFAVNITKHVYTVYVGTSAGLVPVVGNVAFRSEQSAVKLLGYAGVKSSQGTLRVCNVALASSNDGPTSTMVLNSSASSLNFGDVGVSSSATQTVTLTNAGTSSVTISKVSVAGAGFTANGAATGLILSPGQTTAVRAILTPASTGTLTGTLSVASNAANSPANIALSGQGVALAAHAVTLSWNSAGSAVSGYNVYAGAVPGGPYSKVSATATSATTYVDSSVQSGGTYYFVVTAVNSANQESVYSAEVSATVP
jgi:hypothetical protein